MIPKEILITTRYDVSDPKMRGDYREKLIHIDGKEVACYSDEYHDRSSSRIEGFLEAVELFFGKKVKVEYKDVADWDY